MIPSELKLEAILTSLPGKAVGVLGDLFLDRYLDIDARLTEPSIETGLDAYQVVAVRAYPGAAGTVINNLAALGVGHIQPITVIGDDGEGYELRSALGKLHGLRAETVFSCPSRRTPTYTKPMLCEGGKLPRELNRLDIKNRSPMPAEFESKILRSIDETWENVDVLLVLDQVSEIDCGVVTERVRDRLIELGRCWPDRVILADSREQIGLFQSMWLKPNQAECVRAVDGSPTHPEEAAIELSRRSGRPVFCTCGAKGIIIAHDGTATCVPSFEVKGPIDIVGAGDSTNAALACALAGGATLAEAAALGNLVASITIQQLGTTGTASPDQVRNRWREVQQP